MANLINESKLTDKLKRMFSTPAYVRIVKGNKLKVVDSGFLQSAGNKNNGRRPYAGVYSSMYGGNRLGTQNDWTTNIFLRQRMFADYELMDKDSICGSVLDIVADECCLEDEFGDILTIKSESAVIKATLENLFYDVLNVDFNMRWWIRTMLKYGDCFLKLELHEEIGVIGITPLSPYEVVREEGYDPMAPNAARFKYIPIGQGMMANNQDENTFEFYEMVHFRMIKDPMFLPYGTSYFEGARTTWKRLTLLEEAMLLHRIMRAPERRIFNVDVAGIPPNEVEPYMNAVRDNVRKVPHVDPETGETNLRYNIESMLEDFFIPNRGGDPKITIDTLSQISNFSIEDIEYMLNRLMAAFKVPAAYLNFVEDLQGKATLAQQDFRFARTIVGLQKIVVSELNKIAYAHLIANNVDPKLIDGGFTLSLTPPSVVLEQERLELLKSKIELAKDASGADTVFPMRMMYKEIFGKSDEEIAEIMEERIIDAKNKHRLTAIEDDGEDPASISSKQSEEEDASDQSEEEEESLFVDDDDATEDNTESDSTMELDDLRHNYRNGPMGLR